MKMTHQQMETAIKQFRDNNQNYNIAVVTNPISGQIWCEISLSLDNGGPLDAADIVKKKALVHAELVADLQENPWT